MKNVKSVEFINNLSFKIHNVLMLHVQIGIPVLVQSIKSIMRASANNAWLKSVCSVKLEILMLVMCVRLVGI